MIFFLAIMAQLNHCSMQPLSSVIRIPATGTCGSILREGYLIAYCLQCKLLNKSRFVKPFLVPDRVTFLGP